MSFYDEISAAFRDVDETVAEPFALAGASYLGIFATNDLKTQMLTGNYNTVSTLVVRAHKAQFSKPPAQRSGPMLRLKDATQWDVLEVDPNDSTHYVFTVKRRITA